MKVRFSEELWKEGGMFVSYAPELDMAACGESAEQARRNLLEVVQINFEEMRKMGTLENFLDAAGFDSSGEPDTAVQLDKQLIGFETREVAV
jgi:hypothetical protein